MSSERGVGVGLAVLLSVAFLGSWVAMLPVATRLADRMTQVPVDQISSPFPILVVSGGQASIDMTDSPHDVPPPPVGASYLVPAGQVGTVERYLREHDAINHESSWVLRVKPISSERQIIELFLLGDGYWGGVYEATANTITPLYRKVTGPGFALVFGMLALALNAALWCCVFGGIWSFRRYRGAAQQPA